VKPFIRGFMDDKLGDQTFFRMSSKYNQNIKDLIIGEEAEDFRADLMQNQNEKFAKEYNETQKKLQSQI